MRRFAACALVASLVMVAIGIVVARAQIGAHSRETRLALESSARSEQAALDNYFGRARDIVRVSSQNPALAAFYRQPGPFLAKLRRGGPLVDEANAALAYVERLYPNAIGEACIIDRGGHELARAVLGKRTPFSDLSTDESGNPFFHPTFALPAGQVYQAAPYVSPDTGQWVVSNSTTLPNGRAFFHFEVSVESFRQQAAAATRTRILVIDRKSGRIIVDTTHPQAHGGKLGEPANGATRKLAASQAVAGTATLFGRPTAFRALSVTPGNANRWMVAAVGPAQPSLLSQAGAGAWSLFAAALLVAAAAAGLFRLDRRQRAVRAGLERDRAQAEADRAQREAENHELAAEAQERAARLESLAEQMQQAASTVLASAERLGHDAHVGEQAASAIRAEAAQFAEDAATQQAALSAISEAAGLSASRAQDGSGTARTADAAIAQVQQSAETLSHTVGALGDQSAKIGGIVEAITAIASQTNLLALNAAIEAARAGEQGRGFAVVADEVRKLAEDAQRSAGSIGELIGEIRTAVDRAVELCDATSTGVSQSASAAAASRASFEEIDAQLGAVAERLGEVSGIAQRASDNAHAVREKADETEQATGQIQSAAQELVACAVQLRQLGTELTVS